MPATSQRPRRPDESMTLLTEMMKRPLDPAYAAEADRRQSAGLSRTPHGVTPRVTVVMFLIGLLMAGAATALRQPKATVVQQRSALIGQIERRQRDGDAMEAQIAAWEAEIAAAQRRALDTGAQRDLAGRLGAAEMAAAATAVSGPGITVTVDDSRDAGATPSDTDEPDQGRVQSGDLQAVVNGLWQAGAEAIDINGNRLTATSAVRFAGEAILVDYRPLTRPYLIHAIGDAESLRSRFPQTEGGRLLKQLDDQVGIRHTVVEERSLGMNGDSSITLRYARPVQPLARPTSTPAPGRTSRTGTPAATTRTSEVHP
ncbi:DUF881 domain-containing protein [Arsenicicoccus dermatophilus]|uniref:DUF881 domain-containing protein n=1 Tax=Arsenicicoccus dermatophilus TaxID=1076331 RepID=UPI003916F52A